MNPPCSHCTAFALLPVAFQPPLDYALFTIVCATFVPVVLSALYQEKMVTEEDLEDLKPSIWLWGHLVRIQCTKPSDVVTRTAELLDSVSQTKEANLLRGEYTL